MTLPLLPDRSCGACTLCCTVQGIGALRKPPGQDCPNCLTGKGCAIYDRRPGECSAFYCAWRQWPALGEHWFPADSHLMVILSPAGRRVLIQAGPERPDAWKAEPFRGEMRSMARAMMPSGFQVAVQTGTGFIFILPDREVDLGPIADGEEVVVTREAAADGIRFDVHKRRR